MHTLSPSQAEAVRGRKEEGFLMKVFSEERGMHVCVRLDARGCRLPLPRLSPPLIERDMARAQQTLRQGGGQGWDARVKKIPRKVKLTE
jgi:hypothetical protein